MNTIDATNQVVHETLIKLNVGCGGRPLHGYINVDQDSIEEMRRRYPNSEFSDDVIIKDHNIFNLPYKGGTVDEVRADGLLEHLAFKDEPKFLYEVKRVLKKGGHFEFSVPDFEEACSTWLKAKDDWQGFYSDDADEIKRNHWFGTYTYDYKNRWGYIIATFYGSQNGVGQFHKNCYSYGKIRKMMNFLGFEIIMLEKFLWKGDRDSMIRCVCQKV